MRRVYDFALDTLDEMMQRFGPDAVQRVSHDQIRADLLETLEAPITPGEWEEDATAFGMIATRLSRTGARTVCA